MPRSLALMWLALAGCVVQKTSSFRIEEPVPSDPGGFSNALYQATGVKLVAGNEVEPADNGAFFDLVVKDLESATKSIDIVIFIWRPGEPSDRLLPVIAARARAGVDCRILVDAMASNGFPERVQPTLEAAGCKVALARNRITLARNHRKIVIVDGRVAYTGGVGIGREWLGNGMRDGEWRDSNVRVRGPVVEQLERAFAENWLEETGALLPRSRFAHHDAAGEMLAAFVPSAGAQDVTDAELLTHLAIAAAKHRVWIGNAYFLPSPGLTELLLDKRRQGVDVRFMGPGKKTDHPEVLALQRRHYAPLLEAGVRIFEYEPSMFHAKVMLIDDALSVVGSINLDKLSQDLLDEGSLTVFDGAFAKKIEQAWLDDEARCYEVPRR